MDVLKRIVQLGVKSGSQVQRMSWDDFLEENGKQLNAYIRAAGENNARVGYQFPDGVSEEIRTGLNEMGITIFE